MATTPAIAPRLMPACAESSAEPGAWPPAASVARAVRAGPGMRAHLEQRFEDRASATRLRFLGTHLFDLLDKLAFEGGGSELERRRVICAALHAAAVAGAPVVRLWGSLKVTGTSQEVSTAASLLELVLSENARRARPLRFVVTLLNHQPGYGAPRPDRSLDDQDPRSPWSAQRLYLGDGWKAPGHGLLAERIDAYANRSAIAEAPEILGFELVNELDTFRLVPGGDLRGPAADTLREGFIVPALELLARRFPHPILVGDLRGAERSYASFARSILGALPAPVKDRLVWTSHVYVPRAPSARAPEIERATWKLDLDLAIAEGAGLPFLLGEIGQRTSQITPGSARFCRDGIPHDLVQLFDAVLSPPHRPSRSSIEAALFWGEGRCGLVVPGGPSPRVLDIGAGGDAADLGPGEIEARRALEAARRLPRFRIE